MLTNIFAITGLLSLMLFWFGIDGTTSVLGFHKVTPQVLFYALLGGILPTLLWLWFWLKEDLKNPEPRFMIIFAFTAGMIAVPLVIPFQTLVIAPPDFLAGIVNNLILGPIEAIISLPMDFFSSSIPSSDAVHTSAIIFLWAAIEEIFKFIVIYIVALRSSHYNEPIDALIYLITAALGFAALENMLYLITNLVNDGIVMGALNLHLRYLGATLLHIIASSTVGIFLAFAFYRKKGKKTAIFLGLSAATILHTLFNLFIMNAQTILETLIVFSYFWFMVLVLIFLFEKIKTIKQPDILNIRSDNYVR